MSRHSDTKPQVDQTLWQKPKPNDRRTPNSRQRPLNAQPSLQRKFNALHLSEKSRNAGQRREIPALRGGNDPDDSSSQQQRESRIERPAMNPNFTWKDPELQRLATERTSWQEIARIQSRQQPTKEKKD